GQLIQLIQRSDGRCFVEHEEESSLRPQFDPALLFFQHHAKRAPEQWFVVPLFASRTAEIQRVWSPDDGTHARERLTKSPRHHHGFGRRQYAINGSVIVGEE